MTTDINLLISIYLRTGDGYPVPEGEAHFSDPFSRRSRIARSAMRAANMGDSETVTELAHRLDRLVPRDGEPTAANVAAPSATVVKVRLPNGNLAIYAVDRQHLAARPGRVARIIDSGRQVAVQMRAGTEGEAWFLRGGKQEIIEPRQCAHYDRMPLLAD